MHVHTKRSILLKTLGILSLVDVTVSRKQLVFRFNLHIQQMFAEGLLCARHYSGPGRTGEQTKAQLHGFTV